MNGIAFGGFAVLFLQVNDITFFQYIAMVKVVIFTELLDIYTKVIVRITCQCTHLTS